MKPHRKRQLVIIIIMLGGIAIASALILSALKQNINLFYTPSEVVADQVPKGTVVRLGGMVKKGSVQHAQDSLRVDFTISDFNQDINVFYAGVLPNLFREGQGVVVQGQLNDDLSFKASTVLAKHDENYMPPQVAKALQQQLQANSGAPAS